MGSIFQRIVDWFFAFDFFVSYHQGDGKNYPQRLTARLKGAGYGVFLDTESHLPGEDLNEATKRRIRMSKYLVVIARQGAMTRSPWVLQEVKQCQEAKRRAVVIDVDGAYQRAKGETDEERERAREIRTWLPEASLRINEATETPEGTTYDGEPSNYVCHELKRLFKGAKWENRKRRMIGAAAVVIVALLIASVIAVDRYAQSVATQIMDSSAESTMADLDRNMRVPLLNWIVNCKLRASLMKGANPNQDETISHESEGQAFKDDQARQLVTAALLLLYRGYTEDFWPLLSFEDSKHRLRTDRRLGYFLLSRVAPAGIDPAVLASHLDLILSHPIEATSGIRQGLVLALGTFQVDSLAPALRDELLQSLKSAYQKDPDPGVHSAIEWLLTRWNFEKTVREMDLQLSQNQDEYGEARVIQFLEARSIPRRWFVTPHLHTMAIVEPGEFHVPGLELEAPSYFFAISTKEVTVGQWERIHAPATGKECKGTYCSTPARRRTWVAIYEYCDGLTRTQDRHEGAGFFKTAKSSAQKDLASAYGYRLPTQVEWEYACRSGTVTGRFFGDSDALLPSFAWFAGNAAQNLNQVGEPTAAVVGRLLPSPLGLFDIYGNVAEYCIDTPFLATKPPTFAYGGTFSDVAKNVHSSSYSTRPPDQDPTIGFRICKTLLKH